MRKDMRKYLKRPVVMVPVVVGMLSVSSLAAYAYWTATGTGNVAAPVAAGAGITLTGTVANDVAPGVTAVVTITATASPASSQTVRVGTVHLNSVTVDATHQTAGCLASWFTMADVVANQTGVGTGFTLTQTGTLQMTDSTTINQDSCKNAALTLNLTA
jgi:hypothetical protein